MKRVSLHLCLILVVLALCSTAATAQGLMDQLQDEISGIATKASMAVVTIEDGRLATADTFDPEELASAMKEVKEALKDLPGALKGVDVALSMARQFAAMPNGMADADGNTDMSAQVQKGLRDAEAEIDKQRVKETRKLDELKTARREAQRLGNSSRVDDLDQQIEDETATLEALRQTRHSVTETVRSAIAEAMQQVPRVINARTPKTGTGFSIGDGYIVTTADVVDNMQDPTVVTSDGARVRSTVVGVDRTLNLGLIKLKGHANLPALSLGDSSYVRMGDLGVSVGNQAGEANCASLMFIGCIKSDGTPAGERFYPSLFQIAGTLGAGSSGSPLLNSHCEVVGMIVGSIGSNYSQFDYIQPPAAPAVAPVPDAVPLPPSVQTGPPSAHPGDNGQDRHHGSEMGDGEDVKVILPAERRGHASASDDGDEKDDKTKREQTQLGVLRPSVTSAGYAIPISIVRRDIDTWRAGKTVRHAYLGADVHNVTQCTEEDGVLHVVYVPTVQKIVPGSPAEHAGLAAGDAIIHFDGKPLRCIDTIKSILIVHQPGDIVAMEIRRGNETKTLTVTLGAPGNAGAVTSR